VTIHKILHTLELPIVCNFFSAGGKFLLLTPNVNGIENKLRLVKAEIQQEIHDTYFNQFSFLMSHSPIQDFKKEFKIYSFPRTADAIFHKLEVEKSRKSFEILSNAPKGTWNTRAFKASQMYAAYQNNGDCKICGRNPGTLSEVDENGDVIEYCFTCKRDKKYLGETLPKCKYIAFGKGHVSSKDENEGEKIVIFHSSSMESISNKDTENKHECYYVELLEKYECTNEYYLMYNIGKTDEKIESCHLVPIKRYYANHVPTKEKENGKKEVLSFEEIAEYSKWRKVDGKVFDKDLGSELLGVLKVDVDNLGLIFSKGFENPARAEEGLKDIDRKTVSRYLTMSRMLELFFSEWLKEIISGNSKGILIDEFAKLEGIDKEPFKKYLAIEQINFKNIYTVYSGGDDMVLVGSWETMIIFSIFLNMQFRKYTCKNEFITLSAGLTFIKPKFPIASAIKQADALLEKSKEEGKDRITLFGTTVVWDKLPKLINFFLFLNEKLNDDNSKINRAFLYRLYKYHSTALSFLNDKRIEGLKYMSQISYDIARNIIVWDEWGRIKKGKEEYSYLQTLINEKLDKDCVLYNIKLPLYWTLYRNRKVFIDENTIDI
jgi:CRISPR-associated protein Csm1